MHVKSNSSFPRRRFLKGIGASVAVPMFTSLSTQRGFADDNERGPIRMAFMSIPNGVQQDHWFPTGSGRDFEFNATMQPLQSVKSHLQVFAGLKHDNATPGNDGAGDHARANATFLTGARARKTAGKDIRVGVSIDQVAAQALGSSTRLPSIELSCDAVRKTGGCDSGYACAYQYNIAWSSANTPVTPESNPRLVFERLFSTNDSGEQSVAARRQTQRSVLDFVLEDANDVRRELGTSDRRKLDEYLSSVRSVESRIDAAEKFGPPPKPTIEVPEGIPEDYGQHMDLMYDLLRLAFQTDSTRIGTLILAFDGSNRTFPQLGIAEGHHHLTHNQREPDLAEKVARIDQFYMARFAEFLSKMAATEDVGGSLLDNSMIVYGGAIADGNRHTHDNLPVILAGGGGGTLSPGQYQQVAEQPMSNLFVSMLNRFGVPTESFGDSTGELL